MTLLWFSLQVFTATTIKLSKNACVKVLTENEKRRKNRWLKSKNSFLVEMFQIIQICSIPYEETNYNVSLRFSVNFFETVEQLHRALKEILLISCYRKININGALESCDQRYALLN